MLIGTSPICDGKDGLRFEVERVNSFFHFYYKDVSLCQWFLFIVLLETSRGLR